jgi:hypothetical protein
MDTRFTISDDRKHKIADHIMVVLSTNGIKVSDFANATGIQAPYISMMKNPGTWNKMTSLAWEKLDDIYTNNKVAGIVEKIKKLSGDNVPGAWTPVKEEIKTSEKKESWMDQQMKELETQMVEGQIKIDNLIMDATRKKIASITGKKLNKKDSAKAQEIIDNLPTHAEVAENKDLIKVRKPEDVPVGKKREKVKKYWMKKEIKLSKDLSEKLEGLKATMDEATKEHLIKVSLQIKMKGIDQFVRALVRGGFDVELTVNATQKDR